MGNRLFHSLVVVAMQVHAESHDSDVTTVLVKAHLLLGDVASAQSVGYFDWEDYIP